MKKLISLLIITLLCVAGCSSDDENVKTPTEQKKKEYTMTELEDKLKAVMENVEDDIKYLTEDEIKDGMHIIYDECKKQGLPVGQKITVRGKIAFTWLSEDGLIVYLSSDKESKENLLPCLFPITSDIAFIKEGDNVLLEGDFIDSENAKMLMENCQLLSPDIDVPNFENNVEEIVNDAINTYSDFSMDLNYFEEEEVNGIVNAKVDITTDKAKEQISEFFFDDYKIVDYINIYDCIYEICDENCTSYIYLFCANKDLSKGDKVFFKNYLEGRVIHSDEGEREAVIFSTSPDVLYKYSE